MSSFGISVEAQVLGSAEVQAKFARAGQTAREAVYRSVQRLGLQLLAHVKEDKLSGQVLQVRTGRLRRSINLRMSDDGRSVFASVGTNVSYARINELGGKTRPHDIEAKNAQALRFVVGGKVVFVKKVHHPGSSVPERSFLRSALADMRGEILARLQADLTLALKEA